MHPLTCCLRNVLKGYCWPGRSYFGYYLALPQGFELSYSLWQQWRDEHFQYWLLLQLHGNFRRYPDWHSCRQEPYCAYVFQFQLIVVRTRIGGYYRHSSY